MDKGLTNNRVEIIDYLKGISIILILLNHTIYKYDEIYAHYWIYQAVPVFLLVQVFHANRAFQNGKTTLKKWFSLKSILKIIKRIFIPFIVVQLIWTVVFLCKGEIPWGVIEGGHGPGSYYVWIYLQYWLIIPFFILMKNKYGNRVCLIVGLVLSILEEIICCYFFDYLPFHGMLYRMFMGRYLFLIPLGLLFFSFPIKLSPLKILLSIISVVFIYIERYTEIDMTPFFYASSWKGFHWLAYFYTAFVFVFILQWLFNHTHKINKYVNLLGQCSYEIYIVQMLVLGLLWNWRGDSLILDILVFMVKIIVSIVPALIYKRLKDIICINK